MQAHNYKTFLKIMLFTGFFAINNLAVATLQEPESSSENTTIDDTANNPKQENDSATENNTITEDNKPVALETIDSELVSVTKNQEATAKTTNTEDSPNFDEISTNLDDSDGSKDSDTKPINDEVASTTENKDTEDSEQANNNNKQDNKIVIENSYISINPGDNAAAYITVQNKNDEQIRLSEVSVANKDAVAKIETHDNRKIHKVMKMVHKKNGFKIKANSELKLKEGGKHIMLFGINKEFFSEGKNIDLTLKFIKNDNSIIEIIQNFDIKTFKCKKCCSK